MLVVQVAQEMIWVWGDAGPNAVFESALTMPALVPALDDKRLVDAGLVGAMAIAHRDMAYGWDTLMENLVVSMVVS